MNNKPFQEHGHNQSSYLRPNQAWQCANKEGICAQGPTNDGRCWKTENPCAPIRSVRSRKQLLSFWIVAVALASLVITLTNDDILSILSPGPLSVNHAQVADCKTCHTAAGAPMASWLHKAVNFGSNDDNQQCLNCHELGKHAFSAHSTSRVNLLGRTSDQTTVDQGNWKTGLASAFHRFTASASKGVSCSNCHREHQGKGHSLKEFSTEKCHTCHRVKFDEIEVSHPEYTRYPHDTPTRIRFDHVTHLEDYFYDDDYFDIAPTGCKQCHDTDQTGEWMLTQSFETSCSDCHLDQILGQRRASAKGVAVLSIPELDVDTIEQAGFYIGEWPRADGELAPIMRLLLSTASEAPMSLAKNIELYDLTSSGSAELEQVAKLAWSIKELFFDIQSGGTGLLNERLSRAFDGRLDQSMLSRLIASLPRDTLVSNQQDWFPNLAKEVTAYRKGLSTLQRPPAAAVAVVTEESKKLSVRQEVVRAGSDNNDLLIDNELLLDEDDTDPFAEDEDDELLDDFSEDEDGFMVTEDSSIDVQVDINAITAEDWAESGGWYRDGSSIRYRPSDHADPFLKSWLEATSAQGGELSADIYVALTRDDSVGNCMKCHRTSVVSTGFSDLNVGQNHWRSFKPADNPTDFNRFSHVSHFSLMTDDGCSSCHLLNLDGQDDTTVPNDGEDDFDTHFLSMNKNTCTQCHQEGRAPSGCLTCHHYHVDNRSRAIDWIKDELKQDMEAEK